MIFVVDDKNTAGLKVQVPMGDEDKRLGAGEIVWQPRSARRISAETTDTNTTARYNLALGYILQPDLRLEVTPMIEVTNQTRLNGSNSGQTTTTLVPQLRVKWLQYSAGFGVQIPISNKAFNVSSLFDLTYEYLF